jgi:Na+/proline symporter
MFNIASTVGSSLNAVAASMLRDLLDGGLGYKPPEHRAALVTRILCAVFGLLSLAITFLVAELGGVLQVWCRK